MSWSPAVCWNWKCNTQQHVRQTAWGIGEKQPEELCIPSSSVSCPGVLCYQGMFHAFYDIRNTIVTQSFHWWSLGFYICKQKNKPESIYMQHLCESVLYIQRFGYSFRLALNYCLKCWEQYSYSKAETIKTATHPEYKPNKQKPPWPILWARYSVQYRLCHTALTFQISLSHKCSIWSQQLIPTGYHTCKYWGAKKGSMTLYLTNLMCELIAQASSNRHIVKNSQWWVLNEH